MPDEKKPRKPYRRASKMEQRQRRERVAHLRARGKFVEDIFEEIKGDFPHATLEVIYKDVQFIKNHAKDYIALEYLPNFGDYFQRGILTLEQVITEAWQNYEQGVVETHHTVKETKDGGGTEEIHTTVRKGKSPEWLRLAAQAGKALIVVGESGPAAKNLTMVMAEYKRLKELEKKGKLLVVPT